MRENAIDIQVEDYLQAGLPEGTLELFDLWLRII
jgi:hypothetical protein